MKRMIRLLLITVVLVVSWSATTQAINMDITANDSGDPIPLHRGDLP